MPTLSFETPDHERFPCLGLADRALSAGGVAPAVLNAADEVAVSAFLQRRISFPEIADVISDALDAQGTRRANCIDEILAVDREVRDRADRRIRARARA